MHETHHTASDDLKNFFHVTGLTCAYGNVPVLKNISLSAARHEIIALVGPSGAGKSTLLRSLVRLEHAQAGRLCLSELSLDLAHPSSQQVLALRKRTAFVFQDFNLFLNKTAFENVVEPLITVHRMPKVQAHEIAHYWLHRVGIESLGNHYPIALSGGQQQRVAIARALAPNPELVLMDEPTSALDPARTASICALLRELAETGPAILLVTHDLPFARMVSDQLVVMESGEILESGPTEQLFTSAHHPKVRQYLG